MKTIDLIGIHFFPCIQEIFEDADSSDVDDMFSQ